MVYKFVKIVGYGNCTHFMGS